MNAIAVEVGSGAIANGPARSLLREAAVSTAATVESATCPRCAAVSARASLQEY